MDHYEYRSRMVTNVEWQDDIIERTCNEWAKEGWEIFSLVCPQPSNYLTYRITARRSKEADYTPALVEEP